MMSLDSLRDARAVGFIFSGGSARCAFQIGVLETLQSLDVRPSLCIGVSGGAWNAAAVAAGTEDRLRYYWRSFSRAPSFDLTNIFGEDRSPFIFRQLHERNFERYIGRERLLSGPVPLLVNVTRLRDRTPRLFDVRDVEDPLDLLLATNYLPPFYTRAPRIEGERYGDGGATDNIPYEAAFEQGCDAVVIITLKGASEGGLYRSLQDTDHEIDPRYSDRVVVIRPRHRVPVSFVERRWEVLSRLIQLGRLRAREVLLGESHPETGWKANGDAWTVRLSRMRDTLSSRFGGSDVPSDRTRLPAGSALQELDAPLTSRAEE